MTSTTALIAAAVATAITRIMVIPAVSDLLTAIGLGPVGKESDR